MQAVTGDWAGLWERKKKASVVTGKIEPWPKPTKQDTHQHGVELDTGHGQHGPAKGWSSLGPGVLGSVVLRLVKAKAIRQGVRVRELGGLSTRLTRRV